jgi:hypothetical protein
MDSSHHGSKETLDVPPEMWTGRSVLDVNAIFLATTPQRFGMEVLLATSIYESEGPPIGR